MKTKKFKNSKGFSLIEILIAIGVISVFIAGAVSLVGHFQKKAQEVAVKSLIADVNRAIVAMAADPANAAVPAALIGSSAADTTTFSEALDGVAAYSTDNFMNLGSLKFLTSDVASSKELAVKFTISGSLSGSGDDSYVNYFYGGWVSP